MFVSVGVNLGGHIRLKVGQTRPKWDKSGNFQDLDFSTFWLICVQFDRLLRCSLTRGVDLVTGFVKFSTEELQPHNGVDDDDEDDE